MVKAVCEWCNAENEFSARPNDDDYEIDQSGYFVDLDGYRIESDYGPMPAHFGRRCQGMIPAGAGQMQQCGYRWTQKLCPHCEAENDIAARYCSECRGELVDPNEKLRIEFKAMKCDPSRMQCDRVINMEAAPTISRSGRPCIKVQWTTEYRSFPRWYVQDARPGSKADRENTMFHAATMSGTTMPETVTYRKQDNGLYETLAFNQPADEEPSA